MRLIGNIPGSLRALVSHVTLYDIQYHQPNCVDRPAWPRELFLSASYSGFKRPSSYMCLPKLVQSELYEWFWSDSTHQGLSFTLVRHRCGLRYSSDLPCVYEENHTRMDPHSFVNMSMAALVTVEWKPELLTVCRLRRNS